VLPGFIDGHGHLVNGGEILGQRGGAKAGQWHVGGENCSAANGR